MKVDPTALRGYLSQASFEANGDNNEQRSGHFLLKAFPNCQRYWQSFVVPLTRRMDGYPDGLSANISFRQLVSTELQDLSSIHYSVFLNLVFAHVHLEVNMVSSLGDFYVHLGSACDLIEAFLEKWYLSLLKCRGESTKILKSLSRDEFLQLAGEWYDKKYTTLYEHYLSKGKAPTLHLPAREHLLKECTVQFLAQAGVWKEYMNHSRSIREFRNVIVHDVQIGRLLTYGGGEPLIPKPTVIQRYRTWREVMDAANDSQRIARDFAPQFCQLKGDLEKLETIANRLWKSILQECESEFYSPERGILRGMYQVEF